jgi:hypothetical protein
MSGGEREKSSANMYIEEQKARKKKPKYIS